jgi:hypothetical protein
MSYLIDKLNINLDEQFSEELLAKKHNIEGLIVDEPISNKDLESRLRVYENDEHCIQLEPEESTINFFKECTENKDHINPIDEKELNKALRIYKTDEYIIIIPAEGEELELVKKELEGEYVNYRVIRREKNRKAINEYLKKYSNDEKVIIKEVVGEELELLKQNLSSKKILPMSNEEVDKKVKKFDCDEKVIIKPLSDEELKSILENKIKDPDYNFNSNESEFMPNDNFPELNLDYVSVIDSIPAFNNNKKSKITNNDIEIKIKNYTLTNKDMEYLKTMITNHINYISGSNVLDNVETVNLSSNNTPKYNKPKYRKPRNNITTVKQFKNSNSLEELIAARRNDDNKSYEKLRPALYPKLSEPPNPGVKVAPWNS